MEIDKSSPTFMAALRDFRRARQQAVLEDVLALLTGKSDKLLAYDDVYRKLKAGSSVNLGLQEIPLNAIVGSVGRYTDFTRSFLPRSKSSSERWAEVKASIIKKGQIPPISVFKIDQIYFVLDGNHRVSIARQRGDIHIPAYVTEIETDVPIEPDVQPDELIIKARYADFLADTQLHAVRPQANLTVTAPGHYRVLAEHIDLHRHYLRESKGRDVSVREATRHWYDEIYLPVIHIIRRRGILRHFPNRTETDLYVWVIEHQEELEGELGWEVDPHAAADDLISQFSSKPAYIFSRVKKKLLGALMPDPLEPGPPPGQWRKERLPVHNDRLFTDILVPVAGTKAHWAGVTQALVVAEREQARLHGLHVMSSAHKKHDTLILKMRREFEQRCGQANIQGELSFETGKVIPTICNRSRWTDLVVIHLSHLPRPKPGDRLLSGFGRLIRSCPRPVLAIPHQATLLNRALLAYDGSPKANEALFVATYLAGKWGISLVVVTVLEESHITAETIARAREYLETHNITATFILEQGVVAQTITNIAQSHNADFIIMGGYGFNPVLEVMLGSEVDQILRAKKWPVLICR